jgi:tetratricopeptide (TPR) repeat protein
LKSCLEYARQPSVPKDFPPAVGTRWKLAWVYVFQNDPTRAEPLAAFAHEHLCRITGAGHPYTLNAATVLAYVYLLQGRYDEASALIVPAVGASRKAADVVPRLAFLLGMRGQILVARKEYAEAEKTLAECIAVWEKRLPQGGYFPLALSRRSAAREAAFAKCLLGASLFGQKKYKQAEQLLQEGYAGLKAQPGFAEDSTPYAHRSRVDTLTRLVQLYDGWNNPAEAAKWRQELEKAKDEAKKP